MAAAAMMLGSLCPWVTVSGFIALNGIQRRLGWITLIAGVVVATFEHRPGSLGHLIGGLGSRAHWITAGAGVIAAGLCLLVILGLGGAGPLMQIDWGLYVTFLACVVVLATHRRTA